MATAPSKGVKVVVVNIKDVQFDQDSNAYLHGRKFGYKKAGMLFKSNGQFLADLPKQTDATVNMKKGDTVKNGVSGKKPTPPRMPADVITDEPMPKIARANKPWLALALVALVPVFAFAGMAIAVLANSGGKNPDVVPVANSASQLQPEMQPKLSAQAQPQLVTLEAPAVGDFDSRGMKMEISFSKSFYWGEIQLNVVTGGKPPPGEELALVLEKPGGTNALISRFKRDIASSIHKTSCSVVQQRGGFALLLKNVKTEEVWCRKSFTLPAQP